MYSVNMMYNKKARGYIFYINDVNDAIGDTIKFTMSLKTINKRNLDIIQLRDFIKENVNEYGISSGIDNVMNYYNED